MQNGIDASDDFETPEQRRKRVEGRAGTRLSPGLSAGVAVRARLEQQVRGDVPVEGDDADAVRQARSIRSERERVAGETSDLRDRIDAVQTGEAGKPPDWAGYLQGRGMPEHKIRAARALNGMPDERPVNAVGPKMDPNRAQHQLESTERFENTGGENIADVAKSYGVPSGSVKLTTAQRHDPAYKTRVETARQASQAPRCSASTPAGCWVRPARR